MKFVYKICGVLTFMNGVGHLLVVVFYERQSSFWLMVLFGCLYTGLGLLVWFKGKKPLLLTAGLMVVAGPIALMSVNSLGYPVKFLGLFIGMDIVVILLTALVIFRKESAS